MVVQRQAAHRSEPGQRIWSVKRVTPPSPPPAHRAPPPPPVNAGLRPENAEPPPWFGSFRRGRVQSSSSQQITPNLTTGSSNAYREARAYQRAHHQETSFLQVQPARFNSTLHSESMEQIKMRFASTAPPVVQTTTASLQPSAAPSSPPYSYAAPPNPTSPIPSYTLLMDELRLLRESNEMLASRNAALERESAIIRAKPPPADTRALAAERDALRIERDALRAELEAVSAARESLREERNALVTSAADHAHNEDDAKAALEFDLETVRRECERQRAQIVDMQQEAERTEAARASVEAAIASNRDAIGVPTASPRVAPPAGKWWADEALALERTTRTQVVPAQILALLVLGWLKGKLPLEGGAGQGGEGAEQSGEGAEKSGQAQHGPAAAA